MNAIIVQAIIGYYLAGAVRPDGKTGFVKLETATGKEACAFAVGSKTDLYELIATGEQGKPLEVRMVRAAWCGEAKP